VSDKYDDAIEWLVAHADDESKLGRGICYDAWVNAATHTVGCLFDFCTPSGRSKPMGKLIYGCLTMIRRQPGKYIAWTDYLTREIVTDDRIPKLIDELCDLRGDELRAALQPFAEWQRRLDREIRQPALATEGAEVSQATKHLREHFEFCIQYFKPSGKFYTEAKVEWEIRVDENDSSYASPYMPDVCAKLRGLRDNGGQGSLPGLSGTWDGPIYVTCDEGYPCLILPRDA
jgi:hypothetical protein